MADLKNIRVAVNGYGVIGKRVAAAVALQGDMSLAGVSDVVTDWCGMQVDPAKAAGTSEYNGKTYYFCFEGLQEQVRRESGAVCEVATNLRAGPGMARSIDDRKGLEDVRLRVGHWRCFFG